MSEKHPQEGTHPVHPVDPNEYQVSDKRSSRHATSGPGVTPGTRSHTGDRGEPGPDEEGKGPSGAAGPGPQPAGS
jgi:hypothetical protein